MLHLVGDQDFMWVIYQWKSKTIYFRVTEFWEQGCRVSRFQGRRVPRFQGSKVPGLHGSKIPRLHSSWHNSPPKRLKPIRIVVGKVVPLHWELHLQFPNVHTLWTIKTQPECSWILPKFGEHMFRNLLRSHWTEHQRDDKGMTSQMLRLHWGMHKRDAEGWHCPLCTGVWSTQASGHTP